MAVPADDVRPKRRTASRAANQRWDQVTVYWHLRNWLALGLLTLPFVLGTLQLLALSGDCSPWPPKITCVFRDVYRSFDPIFFQYNLILFAVTVLIVPVITFFYVVTMRDRKRNRLQREIPAEVLASEEMRYGDSIDSRVIQRISFGSYFGSVLLLMLVIALGASIMLLFKPSPFAAQGAVDYSKGANFLILGTAAEFVGGPAESYYHRVIVSLTAFQFGFLGAYIYFVGQLGRSFFTFDLTPGTYVEATVRMITASVLSIVLSFYLFSDIGTGAAVKSHPSGHEFLPVLSFFFGFFPLRALLVIEKIGLRAVKFVTGQSGESYKLTPLSSLPGMSYDHEIRLRREGIDNVENLAHMRAIDLAVRTRFTYSQLVTWIEQAWLSIHLREDYDQFIKTTGVASRSELLTLLRNPVKTGDDVANSLLGATARGPEDERVRHKLVTLCELLRRQQLEPMPLADVKRSAEAA
jgi:hypothetical protein